MPRRMTTYSQSSDQRKPSFIGNEGWTDQRSNPFGGALPHLSLYVSTASSNDLLCLAILDLHLISPSLNSANAGCVNPVGMTRLELEFPCPLNRSSSKSGSSSRIAKGLDLTTPDETSSSCMNAALAFSAADNASKGERKRHSPSSSYSAGRSGVSEFKIGGSHFEGEK